MVSVQVNNQSVDSSSSSSTNNNECSVRISWSPAAYDGNSPVTSFEVNFREKQNSKRKVSETWNKITTTSTSVVLKNGLKPFTWYEVKVRAENAIGSSDWSPIVTFLTEMMGQSTLLLHHVVACFTRKKEGKEVQTGVSENRGEKRILEEKRMKKNVIDRRGVHCFTHYLMLCFLLSVSGT